MNGTHTNSTTSPHISEVVNPSDIAEVKKDQLEKYFTPRPKQIGRQAGEEHLKPLDIKTYMTEHKCETLLQDKPWIAQSIKLVANPYMYRTPSRANYAKNRVEIGEKLMKELSPAGQRAAFIMAVCHFLAEKEFKQRGGGKGYEAYVEMYLSKAKPKNYSNKGQSNSTGRVVAEELEEA